MGNSTYDNFANALASSPDPYSQAAGQVMKAIDQIVGSFGKGRKEADKIVTYQNQLGQLLDTANRAMADQNVTAAALIQMKDAVIESGNSFLAFIQDRSQFPDGRASTQAEATMFGQPGYLRVTVENLDKTIMERGGYPALGLATAAANPMVLAGAGVLALFLLMRK